MLRVPECLKFRYVTYFYSFRAHISFVYIKYQLLIGVDINVDIVYEFRDSRATKYTRGDIFRGFILLVEVLI